MSQLFSEECKDKRKMKDDGQKKEMCDE